LLAKDWKATYRPSEEIAGAEEALFPWTPLESTLTRSVAASTAVGNSDTKNNSMLLPKTAISLCAFMASFFSCPSGSGGTTGTSKGLIFDKHGNIHKKNKAVNLLNGLTAARSIQEAPGQKTVTSAESVTSPLL
jgi:hypothetical protein